MIISMPEVSIGTRVEGLLLTPEPSVGAPNSVLATLRLDGLEAKRRVANNYATGFQDLADFFAGLADDWRGWTGARRWESLEGDLTINARHQRSHVVLKIELRCDRFDWDNDGWRVVGDVTIDPGEQLSRVVRDLALFARG